MVRLFCAFLMGVFLLGGWTPGLAQESLTLKESLVRAYKNNAQLLEAEKDLQTAKAQLSQARSLFFPKVNLNLNYVRFRNETLGITSSELGNTILEAPIPQPDGNRSNPLAENLYVGRIGFQQTLYAGGRVSTTHKLSKANVRRAEITYESLKRDIQRKTTQGYYSLLAVQEKKAAIDQALGELDALAKRRMSAHEKLAVTRLSSQLKRDRAKAEQKESKEQLNYFQLMGIELFSQVTLIGRLQVSEVDADFQTVLAWAKQNRIELKETQLQAEVDQLSVNLSMSERYPVFLFGGGYEVRNHKFPLENTNWNAVVSMNIPIFDGFSSIARIRESRYRAQKGKLQRVKLEDQVEKEVRAAFDAYSHWKKELGLREKDQADLASLEDRYKGTKVKGSEKMEFLNWSVTAKMDVIEAQHSLCMAYAELERAIGRTPVE